MVKIAPFADSDEDLELYWLAGLTRGDNDAWQVLAVTRGLATGTMKKWPLSIGFLPILALGRYFVGDDMLDTQARGITKTIEIPNVADGKNVSSDAIPPGLYSFGGRRGGVQRLFIYQADGTTVIIPAIELARALFIHNKILAHTLMHPGGLLELFRPEEVGLHTSLHLRFTAQMPINDLNDDFVGEFAWLALHPDGRRSWDSVYEGTHGRDYVSFRPPPLLNSKWTFRGVHVGNVWLVLELQQITGKQHPCRKLLYSHPSLRKRGAAHRGTGERPLQNRENGRPTPELVAASTRPSKTDIHQPAIRALTKGGSFTKAIKIKRVLTRAAERQQGSEEEGKARRGTGHFSTRSQDRRRQIIHASTAEPAVGWGGLPPVEFRLLERAGWERLGQLEPLARVITMMAEMLPDVEISMSLCLLKPDRSFAWVGVKRRACLVAVFAPSAIGAPVVLLDVDHSGKRALATLLLRYRKAVSPPQIDEHIKALLDGMANNGGHWDSHIETRMTEALICERLRKVLRQEEKLEDNDYLNVWTERLNAKLCFSLRPPAPR